MSFGSTASPRSPIHPAHTSLICPFPTQPLTILLAGRNSPISFVTGASFSTLQMYHRWVARVTFCELVRRRRVLRRVSISNSHPYNETQPTPSRSTSATL